MKANRNLGLDIARICAMCGIVILHILGQGGALTCASRNDSRYWMIWWIEICAYCSVDLFALLSGWLGIKKKNYSIYRTLELIAVVIGYCVVITAVAFIIRPNALGSGKIIIKSLVPYLFGRYWYITCYIPIAILQPFINKMLMILSESQHKKVCILSVLLFSLIPTVLNRDLFAFGQGYSFIWLVICYMIGAYLKRRNDTTNRIHISKRTCAIVFGICSLILLAGKAIYDFIFKVDGHYFIEYTSPIVLLMSVVTLLFMEQLKVKIGSRFIEKMSTVAFDVYIIHCHILIFDIIICNHFRWITNMPIFLIPFVVVILAVIIYLVLSAIGIIRSFLYEKIYLNKLLKNVAIKVDKVIYDAER